MKTTALFLCLTVLTAVTVSAAGSTKYLQGCSSTVFYDANKRWGGKDTAMCGSVSGANVLAWWQDNMLPANKVNAGAPRTGSAFLNYAVTQLESAGVAPEERGDFASSIWQWVIQGYTPHSTGTTGQETTWSSNIYPYAANDVTMTGNWSSDYGFYEGAAYSQAVLNGIANPNPEDELNALCTSISYTKATAAQIRTSLTTALNNNWGIVLNIAKWGGDGNNNMVRNAYHAINMWGGDFDASGNLTAIHITNGDDGYSTVDETTGVITDHDEPVMQKLSLYEVAGNENDTPTTSGTYVFLSDVNGLGTDQSEWMIDSVDYFTLTSSAVSEYVVQNFDIPEPSTATLSLAGLALLAFRRRK